MDLTQENSQTHEKGFVADILFWSKMASTELLESIAGHHIGNVLIKFVDGILWVIEKTSQWSLPNYDKTNTAKELIRPLPWILFLPLLLMLRIIRDGLSFGALMLGKEPIRPTSIVNYIQYAREFLQNLKAKGLIKLKIKTDVVQNKNGLQYRLTRNIKRALIKVESAFCFNAVTYTNGSRRLVRQNSGEILEIDKTTAMYSKNKRSSESNGENDSVLKNSDEENDPVRVKYYKDSNETCSYSSESTGEFIDREVNVDIHHEGDEDVSHPRINSDINCVDSNKTETNLMNGETNMKPNAEDAIKNLLQFESKMDDIVNKKIMATAKKISSTDSNRLINSESNRTGASPEIIITDSDKIKPTAY